MACGGDNSFRPCTLTRIAEVFCMQDMPGMMYVRRHPQRSEHQPQHPPPAQMPSHRSAGRKPPFESSLHAPHFAIVNPYYAPNRIWRQLEVHHSAYVIGKPHNRHSASRCTSFRPYATSPGRMSPASSVFTVTRVYPLSLSPLMIFGSALMPYRQSD